MVLDYNNFLVLPLYEVHTHTGASYGGLNVFSKNAVGFNRHAE